MPNLKTKPAFKAKYKCVVATRPKFKAENIVIRSENGHMTVERVVNWGGRKRRTKQPWPKDLMLVVRGKASLDIIRHFKEITDGTLQPGD